MLTDVKELRAPSQGRRDKLLHKLDYRFSATCCDICDSRSLCEQSGRTTGRLGSTGLRAMPSEGRHSRHSRASTAAIAAGPRHYQRRPLAGSDLPEDGPRRRRRSPRDSHESAVGRRSSWRSPGGRGPGRHHATGPTTMRPGAGQRVSPEHWTRSGHKRQSQWHVQGYCVDQPLLFLTRVQP
jgi:hypothetical protein